MAIYYEPSKNGGTICLDLSPKLQTLQNDYPGLSNKVKTPITEITLTINGKSVKLNQIGFYDESSHLNYQPILGYTPSNYGVRVKGLGDVLGLKDLVGQEVSWSLSW